MEIETIFRLLSNSGFKNLGADGVNIYMEDPACIVRSFETFLEHAWVILVFITGIMLAGWAWMMIRGSKNAEFTSIANNLKSLILIFGALSVVPAVVNFIYGGDLIGAGCKTIAIPLDQVNQLLEMRNEELKKYDAYNLYENFDIYDSGATMAEMPYADVPLTSAGAPGDMYAWSDSESNITDAYAVTQMASGPESNNVITLSNSSDTPPAPAATPIISISNSMNMTPVRAIESGKDVIFVADNNRQYKHVGGTRAWRNNNPGNIRMSDFSRRAGAIGTAGGFAVFPDEQTGMRAVKQLLRSESYNKLTIAGAISRYAPPAENNTAAYHRSIEKMTGLSINRIMSDLSDTELDKVANAIRQIEGWKPGTVVEIKQEQRV